MASKVKAEERQSISTSEKFLLRFSPKHWGQAERYSEPAGGRGLTNHGRRALSGVTGHFNKFMTLHSLVDDLIPTLEQDKQELHSHGFTEANQSRKLAAILETMVVELYSVLDCTRQVLKERYENRPGMNPKSTSRLIENARSDRIDHRVPERIRKALALGPWFDDLKQLRDDIVHSDVGTCYKVNDQLIYHPSRRGPKGESLHINDVMSKLIEMRDGVNQAIGHVFLELNATLGSEEINVVCGLHKGRIYERYVVPVNVVDRHSGRCKSRDWFDKKENEEHRCPLVERCDAYRAKADEKKGKHGGG